MSRTARNVSGRRPCTAPLSSTPASSSSAKNAFPSDRRAIESTRGAAGGAPRIAVSNAVRSSRSNRRRSIRSHRACRSASASQAVSGCRRCSSSARKVATMNSRSSRTFRARNDRTSRVDRSAQCRSSMMSATGVLSPRPPSSRRIPSRMRPGSQSAWAGAASGVVATSASSGTSWARSGRLEPAAAAMRSRSTSRTSARSASTIGPNGRPSSPRATDPPSRTSQPRSRRRVAISWISRLLPTPASPPMSATEAVPEAAASAVSRSVCSSMERPTNTGLERRRAMRRMIGPARFPSGEQGRAVVGIRPRWGRSGRPSGEDRRSGGRSRRPRRGRPWPGC